MSTNHLILIYVVTSARVPKPALIYNISNFTFVDNDTNMQCYVNFP